MQSIQTQLHGLNLSSLHDFLCWQNQQQTTIWTCFPVDIEHNPKLLHRSVHELNLRALDSKITLVLFPSWLDTSSADGRDSRIEIKLCPPSAQSMDLFSFSPPLKSFQLWFLFQHCLGESPPALLSLFQSVQDELAGVYKTLHAVNETRFSPGIQLGPRFIHAFFPANLCHLMDQLLKSLFLGLDFDEMLKLRVSRRSLTVHLF